MSSEADANPVRVALVKFLKADPKLKEMSNGVFYRKAQKDHEVPYVVVSKQSGVPQWTFDGPPLNNEVYLVKGVGSPNDAEAIDIRCKELLNRDTEFAIEGRTLLSVLAINDIDYEDPTDGERYQHVGAEYRIHSEEDE